MTDPLDHLSRFRFLDAIFGRCARRFGMGMAIGNGNVIMDDAKACMADDLDPFIRSGLLKPDKRVLLSVLQRMANVFECAFMGHNIVLTLQAMGLGGLYFNSMIANRSLGSLPGPESKLSASALSPY